MKHDRFAFAQFCDDIRYEIGNKQSMMGMYAGQINVNDFPTTLPKLCCVANFVFGIKKMPKEVSAKLFSGDTEMMHQVLPSDYLPSALKHLQQLPEREKDPLQTMAIGFHFILAPFSANEPVVLRVVFFVDGEEWEAGKLRVQRGETATFGIPLPI